MPYDAKAPLEEQITTTLSSSLTNLTFPSTEQEPYVDSLVLHSPLRTPELTLQAWRTLSSLVPTKIRSLGISNTTLPILQALTSAISAYPDLPFPAFVQNRFYAGTSHEVSLRKFCREEGIVFQSFWTLTGNPELLNSAVVEEVARALHGRVLRQNEKAIALYGLVSGLGGVAVLNGTTNLERMRGDLEGMEILAELVRGEWAEKWTGWMDRFKEMIGEEE